MALKKITEEATGQLASDASVLVTQDEGGTESLLRVALNDFLSGAAVMHKIDLAAGTDIDTLYESGWYTLSATAAYPGTPEDVLGQRFVVVLAPANPTDTSFRHMMYYNASTGYLGFRVFYSGIWHDWMRMATGPAVDAVDDKRFRWLSMVDAGVTDLNDLYMPGWYSLGATATYGHTPTAYHADGDDSVWTVREGDPLDTATGQRHIVVFSRDGANSNTYRHMMYYNAATGYLAFRGYFSGSWKPWKHIAGYPEISTVDDKRFKWMSMLDAGITDLDDLYKPGWYTLGATTVYDHVPDDSLGQRLVVVFSRDDAAAGTFRHMMYYNVSTGYLAFRVYHTGTWHAWKTTLLYPIGYDPEAGYYADTSSIGYTAKAQASQGDNVGTSLRVMSYNVARWNNNTSTYLTDDKIFNLRKLLGKINADIICTQEARPYIDGSDTDGTKSAHDYLFKPQYPNAYGAGARYNVIFSKRTLANAGYVYPTRRANEKYRVLQYGILTIDGKTILIITMHPSWNDDSDGGMGEASIATRLQQYTDIFEWARGTKALPVNVNGSGTPVYAPEHTHTVICMDANTATDEDKANIASVAAGNHFVLSNGGALGWFYTCKSRAEDQHWSALDVVAVSDNVIINNIESLSSIYKDLWSDHVPQVADLTLL